MPRTNLEIDSLQYFSLNILVQIFLNLIWNFIYISCQFIHKIYWVSQSLFTFSTSSYPDSEKIQNNTVYIIPRHGTRIVDDDEIIIGNVPESKSCRRKTADRRGKIRAL
jgi:hypothetical protein